MSQRHSLLVMNILKVSLRHQSVFLAGDKCLEIKYFEFDVIILHKFKGFECALLKIWLVHDGIISYFFAI